MTPSGLQSWLAALRVPEAFEVRDQSRAEMAIGLLARVDRKVRAEGVERLLAHPKRAPVARRAHDPRIRQTLDYALYRCIHAAGLHDLIANQLPFRTVAF